MKTLNRAAYGRTTGGRPVKAQIFYVVFAGHSNRAGELAPQMNAWVPPSVETRTGKGYATHYPALYRPQQKAQAAWHMGVARALYDEAGILCGPRGTSFCAFGVNATTKRTQQMKAASGGVRFAGPKTRQRTALNTRGKKRVVSWEDAFNNFKATATKKIRRAVRQWSKARERAFARRCVVEGFRYCNDGARRFAPADPYAAGAHIALPHVRPTVYARQFNRLSQTPERMGTEVVKRYRDGSVLYCGMRTLRAEDLTARALGRLTLSTTGSLTRKELVRALATPGVTTAHYAAVQKLSGGKQAVFNSSAVKDPATLRLLADAYRASRRDVFAVGAAAANALGVPPRTAHGLAESLTRTSHLNSLRRGLRTPGPINYRLWVAEQIRAKGHTRMRKGSLVVVAADDTRDAKALARLAKVVRKADGKLVVTGKAAAIYARKAEAWVKPTADQTQQAKRRGVHP